MGVTDAPPSAWGQPEPLLAGDLRETSAASSCCCEPDAALRNHLEEGCSEIVFRGFRLGWALEAVDNVVPCGQHSMWGTSLALVDVHPETQQVIPQVLEVVPATHKVDQKAPGFVWPSPGCCTHLGLEPGDRNSFSLCLSNTVR